MLLDHFGCIIRKLFHVGIAPTAGLLFELSQILFMVLNHHVDVSLVRSPFELWLFRGELHAFL